MKEGTRCGLGILAAALVLGIAGDNLLRATPWGLNAALFILLVLGGVFALQRGNRIAFLGGGRWLFLPAALFALSLAWRDSLTLKCLDMAGLLIALALASFRSRSGQVRRLAFVETGLALLMTGLNALFGPFLLLLNDIRWKEIPRTGWTRNGAAIGRGLLIALPLLLIFGGLFVAADASFERIVRNLFRIDLDELILHGVLISGFAWITGGFLRQALLREEAPSADLPRPQIVSLGIVEIGIVLGMLDLLFLAFVCVQARYFFGGQAHVLATAGLTSADYARRGFFELVTVAALALPLLLLADWLLRKETLRAEALFRAIAGAMVLLSGVIMASAVQRMVLYHLGYGLTELRFYTTAFMGWLAVLFGWFVWTVLRGHRDRFVPGALVTAVAAIVVLHTVNPDDWIVRANVARIQAHRSFDAGYVQELSADAVPALVKALPALNAEDRHAITEQMLSHYPARAHPDWRAWSWSQDRARRTVNANRAALTGP
jgi:hypothetical protein